MAGEERADLQEFLTAIAPQLADLLRAVAEYLDPAEGFGPDPEDEPQRTMPVPQFRIDERGATVPVD